MKLRRRRNTGGRRRRNEEEGGGGAAPFVIGSVSIRLVGGRGRDTPCCVSHVYGPYVLWCVVITIHTCCTRSAPLLNTAHRTGHLAHTQFYNYTTQPPTNTYKHIGRDILHTHNYTQHTTTYNGEGRAFSSDSARETTESAIGFMGGQGSAVHERSCLGAYSRGVLLRVSNAVTLVHKGGPPPSCTWFVRLCYSPQRTRRKMRTPNVQYVQHMHAVGSFLVFRTSSCSASQPVGVTAPRVIGRKAAGRREGGEERGAGEEALEERGTEGGESSAVCAATVPSAAAEAVGEMRRRRRRRTWRRWREGEAEVPPT